MDFINKMQDIRRKEEKNLAEEETMIRYRSQNQLTIEEFKTPFEIKLSRENRWVNLATVLPWEGLAKIYHRAMSPNKGRPSIDARIIIGGLIIKHKEGLSDEGTIEAIQENVYEQYFLGLTQYQYEPIFDPSLFVTIRKRIGVRAFDAMVQELMEVVEQSRQRTRIDDTNIRGNNSKEMKEDVKTPQSDAVTLPPSVVSTGVEEGNAGMLIVDMTVAPADIAYPTDIELLNTAREKSEKLIDGLYKSVAKEKQTKKPRTYRKKARKDYLAIAKQRKKSIKSIRKAVRKQLGYVGRNIKTIHKLLDVTSNVLSYNEMKLFWVIQELYRQQKEMYEMKTHRVSDRIVSITQPHVRPIVREKEKARTEFGAQVSVSILNGYRRIHRIVWDAYNESADLPGQIEQYKAVYGHYPEIVLADKKYGTQENRIFMKERGIRYGGTPLGCSRKDGVCGNKLPKGILNRRNYVEGTFGTGKRSYGLDRIKARRIDTSASWIAMIFLVMNLPLVLKSLGSLFLSFFENVLILLVKPNRKVLKYIFALS